MTARQRNWEIDWAGPHGTAWGTINACLTTTTVAWLTHLATTHIWQVPGVYLTLGGIITGAIAVIIVLLRAALLHHGQPTATTWYQLACVLGGCGWVMAVTRRQSWPWRWQLASVSVLAAMAIVAGLLAGLSTPPKPDPVPQPAAPPAPADQQETARNDLAAEWEERLNRICGNGRGPADGPGWTVPAIEQWPRGNGYTVEAIAPAGGMTWQAVQDQQRILGGDLDLVQGGKLAVTMGVSRRVALVEVTTVDVLADDYPYPDDRPVHSIRDDLATGIRDDGNTVGPNLLQNCMVIAGEAGSGKTNAAHCVTAEIVTTDDAILWEWELTGGGLWAAWMDPWLRGDVATPPIDWCAWDGQELLWMTRAALRIGYTRKPGYRQAMLDADDDKVPVSPTLPELILMGDEIAKVTGAMTEHPEARENLRLVTFELRAAAVRNIFLALRGTDDVISSSIQSQCQVRAVMKIATKAEAMWVFGNGFDFGPQDTPYPGCGGISLASGEPPIRKKWYRMKPSDIRRVALVAQSRRPRLDELSRLAANGRHPDGTPMPGLLPGELDCYDARWDRFRAAFGPAGGGMPAVRSAPVVQAPALLPDPLGGVATDLNPADALDAAMARLDERVAEVNAGRPDDGFVISAADQEMFAEMTREMEAEGFGSDWGDEVPGRPETAPQPSDGAVLLELLAEAGTTGLVRRIFSSSSPASASSSNSTAPSLGCGAVSGRPGTSSPQSEPNPSASISLVISANIS